jgi:threonylcarbamoyladenosine tRNA methylthiotransferase MtaB
MPTVAFRTLGCKQNQFDSQALRRYLKDRGLRLTGRPEEADWIIITTCAVTERALAKARGDVHRLRRLNPQAKIIVLGCAARYAPEAFAAEGCITAGDPALAELRLFDIGVELSPPHGFIPEGKTRGLLRVQSGCDQTCAYCIVPSLRGPSRSVPLEDLLETLDGLIAENAPEIVLTGTNIALWGRDLPGSPGLADLMAALANRAGKVRLRLSSLEPHLVEPDFLAWCLDQSNVCRHFHFAFQTGSRRVLGLMQRSEPSGGLIEYLRDLTRRDPSVCLGADVIAGFPGETESDFQESLEWIQSIPLSYLHVFPYSERVGTKAASLDGNVSIRERLRRSALLRRLSAELKERFIRSNRDVIQDVIFIGTGNASKIEGLSSNYLRIIFHKTVYPKPIDKKDRRFVLSLRDGCILSIHIQR